MYAEDSFFTLTHAGQLGLVLLSTMLGGLVLAILWCLVSGRILALRLAGALFCFVLFIWITPQIYYLYYLLILDGLPWQFVIGHPPRPGELLDVLLFSDRQNLSFHARGVLGWLMMMLAILQPRISQFFAR